MNSIRNKLLNRLHTKNVVILGNRKESNFLEDVSQVKEKLHVIGVYSDFDELSSHLQADDYDCIVVDNCNHEFHEKSLQACGLVHMEDYYYMSVIKAVLLNKKICLMVGTCILSSLAHVLLCSISFREDYEIVYSDNDLMREHSVKASLPAQLLQMADLYLYTIDAREETMSNDYIKSRLREDCITLSISGCVFRGYFIQSYLGVDRPYKYGLSDYINGRFNCELADRNIDSELKADTPVEDIISKLSADDYYSMEAIDKWVDNSLRILLISEQQVDITMYDFIKEEYKNSRLMLSSEIPARILIEELVRRILYKLGYRSLQLENVCKEAIENKGFPIYPSVLNHMQLQNKDGLITLYDVKKNALREYQLSEYIYDYAERYYENKEC